MKWTDDMDRQLLAAGITPWTERYRPGGKVAEVADVLGVTESAARSRLRRLKQKAGQSGHWTTVGLWTPAEDDVIRERMWLDGPGWREVAESLGRTPGACVTRAVKLRKLYPVP